MRKFTKLNANGAAHIIVPLLAVITIAIAGSYMLVKGHADTRTPQNPKALAASSDMVHYPKLAVQPLTAASNDSPGQSVVSYHQTSSTEATITYYDLAPGGSAQKLYKSLQTKGVKGLLDPSKSNQSSAASPQNVKGAAIGGHPCASGTARVECSYGRPYGQIHWQNSGHSHPQIYFLDSTGSQWPTDKATYEWNKAQGIDSNYKYVSNVYASGVCPRIAGIHCVPIVDGNYGSNGLGDGGIAATTVVTNGDNIVRASIQLNTYNFNLNAYGYRQTICHEEGHALGLDHNTSATSCLIDHKTNSAASQNPNSDDFALVANMYNTVH